MLAKRIIPCLDCDLAVPGGRVVKGIEFKQIRYAGIPAELAEKYSRDGADEICFLDITASSERRETMLDVIRKTSEKVFVPLCAGGGVRSVEDFNNLLKAGADKCSINTAALLNPPLINKASKIFGSQCVVVSIDAKRVNGRYACYTFGGRKATNVDALKWAQEAEQRGAGEILLTSMDRDGTKKGFDLPLIGAISKMVSIPVIASGGAGLPSDFLEVFSKTGASAALAAGIFHYKKFTIAQVKKYLRANGIEVRA